VYVYHTSFVDAIFGSRTIISSGVAAYTTSIAANDIDGDGDVDLVVASVTDNKM